ncbi:hypothetical protein RUND412_011480 [Rhizina undulata]
MNSFQLVPVELVDYILSYLDVRDRLLLRLVDKRFSEIACARTFGSVVTLFGESGLETLQEIAGNPQLAWHVKSFEYRFIGIYEHEMSWERFRTRMAPPGRRSYHSCLLPEFHRHYAAQYEIHQKILSENLDGNALVHALQRFPNLRHVSLRHAGIDEYPHWQESWSFRLKNEILGGSRAQENVSRALEARNAIASSRAVSDEAFSEITSYSVIDLPPVMFVDAENACDQSGSIYRYELNPITAGPGSSLSTLLTLNLDLRRPRQPRARSSVADQDGNWSSAMLSSTLQNLHNLINVRLCVDEHRRPGTRFFEHPLRSVSWPRLRNLILSGWKFSRGEDLLDFIKRHGDTLQYLYIGTLCLVVEKEELSEKSFCRIFNEIRDLAAESTFEGSFFCALKESVADVESGGVTGVTTGYSVALSAHGVTEEARKKRRVVEQRLFRIE